MTADPKTPGVHPPASVASAPVGAGAGGATDTGAGPRRAARSCAGGILRAAIFAGIVCVAMVVGGYFRFANVVADLVPTGMERAEGIVVLTGGRERIRDAIELLRAGRGARLLISGVHRSTRSEDLARAGDGIADLMACCVDLGFEAETTIGNAAETAAWTRAHGFSSLIVVTSAYHMPRSLAEFAAALPGVRLVPFPVRPLDLELDRWYQHPHTIWVLLREYSKFTLARLRLAVGCEACLGSL